MDTYFNIRYEFDRAAVRSAIARQIASGQADYICVADGVILNTVNRDEAYRRVVDGGMFAICDSSYVPLYLRLLYGRRYRQYCGSDIFRDIVSQRRYRMAFLGTDPDVGQMLFYALQFCAVNDFDYPAIARMLAADGADIVWVALGAPKQEIFMARLKPHLEHGVMIAVGAAFKFFSGQGERRAPQWMLRHHLEFAYRIYSQPLKQRRRCGLIGAIVAVSRVAQEKSKTARAIKTAIRGYINRNIYRQLQDDYRHNSGFGHFPDKCTLRICIHTAYTQLLQGQGSIRYTQSAQVTP